MKTVRVPRTVFACSRCDRGYRSREGDRPGLVASVARLNGWEIGETVLCPGCASITIMASGAAASESEGGVLTGFAEVVR